MLPLFLVHQPERRMHSSLSCSILYLSIFCAHTYQAVQADDHRVYTISDINREKEKDHTKKGSACGMLYGYNWGLCASGHNDWSSFNHNFNANLSQTNRAHTWCGRPEFYIFIMIERTRETKAQRSPWNEGCHENMFILCRFGNNIAIKLRNSLMVG